MTYNQKYNTQNDPQSEIQALFRPAQGVVGYSKATKAQFKPRELNFTSEPGQKPLGRKDEKFRK